MKRTAWLNIREGAHYKRDAFVSGLERLGFAVQLRMPNGGPLRDDLFVSWNRYGQAHRCAMTFELRKCPVIVAENGYLGDHVPGRQLFALSLGLHNGAGRWPVGGPERWADLGVTLHPWRGDDGEIVILPQRGIGSPGVAMPMHWLREVSKLGRIRRHPGRHVGPPLEDDLRNARAVVTWGSGAAVRALAWGIPAFHGLPGWIGALAARPIAAMHKGPVRDDALRLRMFERLAWAQWSLEEIASGKALGALLELHQHAGGAR